MCGGGGVGVWGCGGVCGGGGVGENYNKHKTVSTQTRHIPKKALGPQEDLQQTPSRTCTLT